MINLQRYRLNLKQSSLGPSMARKANWRKVLNPLVLEFAKRGKMHPAIPALCPCSRDCLAKKSVTCSADGGLPE